MDISPDRSESTSPQMRTLVRLQPSFFLESSVIVSEPGGSIKPVSLNEIHDISKQEALVMKDLLFALQGLEGNYVRYSERYSPSYIGDRIRGPDYKVAAPLDISLKTATKKLLRYGKFYSGLQSFAQIYNMPHFGRVNQRLCSEISRCLSRVRSLVVQFENGFNTDPHFSLSTMDNQISHSCADSLRHLYEIACGIHAETESRNPRFKSATSVSQAISGDFAGQDPRFDTFMSSVRSQIDSGAQITSDPNSFDACKGGLVLQIVETRIATFAGDAVSSEFLFALFEAISADYVQSLNTWLAEGKVDDPFHEFLVKKNDLPKTIFYSNVERYWEELYVIKVDGLINKFLNKEIQAKILATGKLLNIFRQCIGIASLQDFPENISSVACPETITSLCAQDVRLKIIQFYERANNLMLKLLFKGYHFSAMLTSLHETYLLCHSSKIDTFLNKSLHDLGRNKEKVSTVTLIDTFDNLFQIGGSTQRRPEDLQGHISSQSHISYLLRSFQKFSVDSNNFYDLSKGIVDSRSFDASNSVPGDEQASSAIKKLVSRSLRQPASVAETEKSEGDDQEKNSVIAAVNIDCDLPFPINLFITESFLFKFQLIFKLSMIIRYASKLVESAWCDIMFSTVWKYKNFSEPLQKLILRCRVLISRMKSFVTELQSYVDLSVVDPNFTTLKDTVAQYETTIDTTRPSSRATRSSPPSKDVHRPLSKQANKNNSIFDEKIKMTSDRVVSSARFGRDVTHNDVQELGESIETYLSNILRDSMITDSRLLENLKVSLGIVTEFATITRRLKKTLISTDAALLEAFSRDYSDKFDNIEINEPAVRARVAGLNNVTTKFWTEFNYSLQQFTQDLRQASTENASFSALADRIAIL